MKLTLKDYLNAAITLTFIINLLLINLFIMKLTNSQININTFLRYNAGIYKTGVIVCSVLLVLLNGIKCWMYLSRKEDEEK